jgi:hypothetical protein
MKKLLLLLAFVFAVNFANAQCIPDPQFTAAGIYPDTTIGLADAYVGQSYSQDITVITPTDTVVEVLGQMLSVTIDSIKLTSVSGLPIGFLYSCNPPSCGFPGGTSKCAELYSTINPSASDIGVYDIIFETTSYASNVPFLGTITQDDIIDYYYIEISPATSTINQFDNTTFELKEAYPNPAINETKVQFISGNSENIVFKIYNLLGEEIESQLIFSSIGVNTINLNFSSYSEGIYLYSINNGYQLLTKRLVVNN